MHQCPNCAGHLRFDISAQELLCDYCGTALNPYHFDTTDSADETNVFKATIYSCSSCGAELISDDATVSTFCSYCGSSTFINSRVSEEKKPKYIIPFQKTKEDCKKSYHRLIQRAFFAPKELKDAEHIEQFRAIYMPYWMYSFDNTGTIHVPGTTSRRRGDYIITSHYQLDIDISANYQGINFDASSSFEDTLSGAIAPFDITKGKDFSPSYLSGYYADTNDVDSNVYKGMAAELATEDASKRLLSNREIRRYNVKAEDVKARLKPQCTNKELALFPVWFLAYRNNDRVAYAIVNGQTGKAVSDLPIDIKKFLGAAGVLAIILFILLNLHFTITPTTLLWLSCGLALLCGIISNVQVSRILYRENNEFRNKVQATTKKQQKDKPVKKFSKPVLIFFGYIMLSYCIQFLCHSILAFYLVFIAVFLSIISLFVVAFTNRFKTVSKTSSDRLPNIYRGNWKMKLPFMKKPLLGLTIAILVILWNPVEDLYYYLASIACILTTLWNFTDILDRHNILTTRKLPQFNERGGEAYANETL